MMIRILPSIPILICIAICIGSAQPEPRTPSAAVGSYSKYADIEPSLYTGTMSVPLPIDQVSEGPLSLSVGLSYHSDIKAHQLASEIGLGWSFSGLGMVTREVRGIADDDPDYGFFKTGGGVISAADYDDIDDRELDIAPDIYTFHVAGILGKFTMDENKNVHQIYKSDVLIELVTFGGYSYTFCEGDIGAADENCQIVTETTDVFIITNTDGTKYYFGGNSNKENLVYNGRTTTSAWPLQKIESFDGLHQIEVIYTKSRYRYYSLVDCLKDQFTAGNCGGTGIQNISAFTSLPYRIKTSTSSIQFEYERDRQDLYQLSGSLTTFYPKRISKIHCSEGGFTKSYDFQQTYFVDSGSNGGLPDHLVGSIPSSIRPYTARRLKLNQINLTSSSESISPLYQFEYNDDTDNFFPNQLSHAIDHFGYYNGKINNNDEPDIAPQFFTPFMGGDANIDRNSYFSGLSKGVLTKVIFATGGHTDYNYGMNFYFDDTFNQTGSSVQGPIDNNDCTLLSSTSSSSSITLTQTDIDEGYLTLQYVNSCIAKTTYSNLSIRNSSGQEVATMSVATDDPFATDILLLNNSGLQAGTYTFTLDVSGSSAEIFKTVSTVGSNRSTGGLRLISQQTDDNNGNVISRSYSYNKKSDITKSSGKLYRKPQYGYEFQNLDMTSSNSIANIRSFEGYHIGYESVLVDYNRNGSKRVDFYTDASILPPEIELPIVPDRPRQYVGSPSSTSVFLESPATELSREVIYLNDADNTEDLSILMYAYLRHNPGIGQVRRQATAYSVNAGIYRPDSIVSYQEGIKTRTEFTYDFSKQNEAEISEVFDEANNQISRQDISYTSDMAPGLNRSYLSSRNMLIPWKVEAQINGVKYHESRKIYGMFGSHSRLFIDRSIHTFGSSTITDDIKFDAYGPAGLLTKMTPAGSQESHTFDYHPNHTLKESCIGTLCKEYEYSGDGAAQSSNGSRLLTTQTAVDGTQVMYTYDDLIRLKTETLCTGALVNYDYEINQTRPYTKQVETFNADPLNLSNLTTLESRQYMDGLGRTVQSIGINQSFSGQDQVSAVAYDNQGRVSITYEPFESNVSSHYVTSLSGRDHTIKNYENSPLNRPLSILPPAWNGVTTSNHAYGTNANNVTGADGTIYDAGSLFHRSITDGNGNQTISYSDVRGRRISDIRTDGSDHITTLYEYDNKNRLTEVIPPGSSVGSAGLNFSYNYDAEDKVLSKSIPGKGDIKYRYDNRDLVIAQQDNHLLSRPLGKWYAYRYDSYGRELDSGFGNSNGSITTTLTSRSYYSTGTGKGKLNANNVRMINSTAWINRSNNYDNCGRLHYSDSANYITSDGQKNDRVTLAYDGASNIVRRTEKIRHDNSPVTERTVTFSDGIDTDGRIISSYVDLDTESNVQTCALTYTEKDQIAIKYQGGSTSTYLQQVEYDYLPNQLLDRVNGGNHVNSNDLYGYRLYYWQGPFSNSTSASFESRYNGDISYIDWGDDITGFQDHSYQYDYLDRLEKHYSKNDEYNSFYSYDERGNIIGLSRREAGAVIDTLTYQFKSSSPNQIDKISDGGDSSLGYRKVNGQDYKYDENGNLMRDPQKGITILYNHLDLADEIRWDDGRTIRMAYDAQGSLWRKGLYDSNNNLLQKHDYLGSFEFINDMVYAVMHKEGRIVNEGLENALCYLFLDHQQSIDGDFDAKVIESIGNIIVNDTDYEGEECVEMKEGFEVKPGATFLAHIGPSSPAVESWRYDYEIKDYLGNLRMVYHGPNRNNLTITQRQDYHP